MATSQAGIQAAYATEINSCGFRSDAGPKNSSRPANFCQSVTVQGPTTTVGPLTSIDTSTTGTATFAKPIVVMGTPFQPVLLRGTLVLAAGPIAEPTPPTPGDIFQNITVNGTATIANATWDAGAY